MVPKSNRKRLRLVIADDHDLVREGIRSRLCEESTIEIVGEGANGLEAVELCRDLNPDIVLMDVSMPVMNGIDAAQRIRRQSPSTGILFLSVYDNDEYVREALRIGAKGFVLKDVSKPEMLNAIEAVAQGATYLGPNVAASLAESSPGEDATSEDYGLSAREKEVLAAISKGMSNRDIARMLAISVRTVESHRLSIREKTGGGNSVVLSKIAERLGL